MKKLLLLILSIACVQCATVPKYDTANYFTEYYNVNGYYVYPTDDTTSQPIIYIPAGNTVHSKSDPHKKYVKIYYGSHHGYVLNKGFRRKKTRYREVPVETSAQQDRLYSSWITHFRLPEKYHERDHEKYVPVSTGGRVQVRGYYRKNGTYVRPYTRRAPSRH